jgi:hypothetical protein
MSALTAPLGLTSPHKPDKVTPKRPRRRKAWQRPWLQAYLDYGTIVAACEKAGVGRSTVYDEMKRNPDFQAIVTEIEESITESLEQEGIRRAMDGSDQLLMFMLRSRKPQTYSDQHRVIHSGTSTVEHHLSIEERERELAAFGMPAALAIKAGPEAVEPPPDA